MCNETKVNTNIGDAASPEAKKILPPQYVGWIETPFGDHFIKRGEALDYANIRSAQLASLLLLMSGDGLDRFLSLARGKQDDLMWMVKQLADEIEIMVDVVAFDERGGRA
jgi:hypothetical protein